MKQKPNFKTSKTKTEDKKIVDNKGFIDKSETKTSVKNKEKVPGSKKTETLVAKKKVKKY